ncbi:MAG: diphthine--ammonia ligase [Vicingaceae bacterium]
MKKVALSWSGGKDAAMALYTLLQDNSVEVKCLFTTIYKPLNRVSMHGVPFHLIKKQIEAVGIEWIPMYIENKTNQHYEKALTETLIELKEKFEITHFAFGDIFLEDLKQYREQQLQKVGLEAIFPIWKQDTSQLAKKVLQLGFKTKICCIDLSKIPEALIDYDYSEAFLNQLPKDVDPCGENGEFHTFCYDGPVFSKEVVFKANGTTIKSYENNGTKYQFKFYDLT